MPAKISIYLFLMTLFFSCSQDNGQSAANQERQKIYLDAITQAEAGDLESARTLFAELLEADSTQLPIVVDLRILDDALSGVIQRETAQHLFRAIRFTQTNNMMMKIVALDSAIALDPEYAYSYNERGIAHFEMGNMDASIEDRDRATTIDPLYFEAYFNKGVACEKASRFEEAVVAFDQFLKYSPETYRWHRDYAQIRIAQLTAKSEAAVVDTLTGNAFQ